MLTDSGIVSYGPIGSEFTFPLYSQTHIVCRPVLDTARRATLYVKYTVTVDSFITADPGGDTEAQLASIRQILTTRGGHLTISGKGFGGLDVNGPSTGLRDVAMGPHVDILDCKPIGSRSAWTVTWTAETNVPECWEGTATTSGRPMEYTYTWDIRQDEHGFSTRTVSGRVVIPATILAGQRVQPDSADNYWPQVVASVPPLNSFKRSVSRNLSEDRRTLTFTITDREAPANAFMPGATEWDGTQELSSSLKDGWTQWHGVISATYTVARGAQKKDIYQKNFLPLVASRLRSVRSTIAGATIVPMAFSITDHMSAQTVTFTYRYYFISQTVSQSLLASGLWTAIPNANWSQWAASMAQGPLNARGNAQLAYNVASDSIIDLCQQSNLAVGSNYGLSTALPGGSQYGLTATLPPPNNSWLRYECRLHYESDEGTYSLRTLPLVNLPSIAAGLSVTGGVVTPSDYALTTIQMGAAVPAADVDVGFGFGNAPAVPQQASLIVDPLVWITPGGAGPPSPNIIQQRSTADPVVRLIGRALRVGYSIAPPNLLAAAGRPAVLQRPRFVQAIVANPGVPIVAASWDLTYLLDSEASAALPLPPNPVLGVG